MHPRFLRVSTSIVFATNLKYKYGAKSNKAKDQKLALPFNPSNFIDALMSFYCIRLSYVIECIKSASLYTRDGNGGVLQKDP